MILNALSALFLFLALCVAVLNWGHVIANHRFKQRGVQQRISTMPMIAPLFVWVAAVICHPGSGMLPGWVYLAILLLDTTIYSILLHSFRSLRKRLIGLFNHQRTLP